MSALKTAPRPAFSVPVDVYACAVDVFHDEKRHAAYAEHHGASEALLDAIKAPCEAHATWFRDPSRYMRFLLLVKEDAGAGTVAHECLHLAFGILETKGVEVDAVNHEALAYLVGFIAGQVTDGLTRLRN